MLHSTRINAALDLSQFCNALGISSALDVHQSCNSLQICSGLVSILHCVCPTHNFLGRGKIPPLTLWRLTVFSSRCYCCCCLAALLSCHRHGPPDSTAESAVKTPSVKQKGGTSDTILGPPDSRYGDYRSRHCCGKHSLFCVLSLNKQQGGLMVTLVSLPPEATMGASELTASANAAISWWPVSVKSGTDNASQSSFCNHSCWRQHVTLMCSAV